MHDRRRVAWVFSAGRSSAGDARFGPTDLLTPLRICFITPAALPHVGGIEIVVDNLARTLRGRGHQIEHIAPRWPENTTPDAQDRPEPHHADRVAPRLVRTSHIIERLTGLQYPLVGLDFFRSVRDAAERADVVHAHNSWYLTSALGLSVAARAARQGGVPVRVVTEHGGLRIHDRRRDRFFESLAIGSAVRASLRSAQAVVQINSRIAEEFEAIRPGKPTRFIANGVDCDFYRPPEPGERERIRASLGWDDRPRVLAVGRVGVLKGADLLIEIARGVGGDAELVLAGPGEPPSLPRNATALGGLPPAEIARLYRAADCLLHPSRAEGFPLVLQEAAASGLPVVIADDPGYEPHLGDAPAAIVRARGDAASLIEALRGIRFGAALTTQDRTALTEFAQTRFSWERCADDHEALYRELLERRRTEARI